MISMNFLLEFRLSQQWVHAKNSLRISIFICVCCNLLMLFVKFPSRLQCLYHQFKSFSWMFYGSETFCILFYFSPRSIRQAAKNEIRDEIIVGWVLSETVGFCWVLIEAARATPFRNVLTQVAQPFFAIKNVETATRAATLKNLHIS